MPYLLIGSSQGRIHLPSLFRDGRTYEPIVAQFGLGGRRSSLYFHVAYHPGCDIRHPLEEFATAVRIWPTPAEFDPAQLIPLDVVTFDAWSHTCGSSWQPFLVGDYDPFENPWQIGLDTVWTDLPGVQGAAIFTRGP